MFWLLVAVLAGVIQGSFALPMKYTARWKWEHTWSLWAVWALLILPWAIAGLTVPGLIEVYRGVSAGTLVLTFAVSLAWGVGAIAFGFGIDYLGMAIGYAIIAGLTTAFGSLIPLFINPGDVLKPTGLAIIGGIAVMMLGMAIGAKAGLTKEKALARGAGTVSDPEGKGTGTVSEPEGGARRFEDGACPLDPTNSGQCRDSVIATIPAKPVVKGLLICVVAGVGGALMNVAFVVGSPIQRHAQDLGVDPTYAPNAVWCISLLGGLIVNLTYCLRLVSRGKAWSLYGAPGTGLNWLRTAAMGAMWFGSLTLYGISSARLGPQGPATGFAVFLGTAILTSNLWGIFTGEWKGAGRKPLGQMLLAIAVLLGGMAIIAWSKMLPAG